MRRLIPSPALVVALLAVLLATGGVGYAAGQIRTKDIRDGAVTSLKIRDGAVAPADLDPSTRSAMRARAWANVDLEPELVPERTKGFATVTRPRTGVYCLTLSDDSLDPATTAPVVTVDWDSSAAPNIAAYLSKSAHQCPESADLGVRTYAWAAGRNSKLADTVAFTIDVP
jgi:hypothetical protein